MSKCTAAQAVAEMEYWIGYYEKASGSYATTPDKSAFEKNKGSANYTYFGYVCGVQGQPWCAATISTVMLRACGGSQADAKAKVLKIKEKTLVVEIADGVEVEVLPNSVNPIFEETPVKTEKKVEKKETKKRTTTKKEK